MVVVDGGSLASMSITLFTNHLKTYFCNEIQHNYKSTDVVASLL